MLAVMDYGNPRWYERMLEIGTHYDELTGINPKGHRHYRSNRYGASEIVTEGALRLGHDRQRAQHAGRGAARLVQRPRTIACAD